MALFYNVVSWRVTCPADEVSLRPTRIGKLARKQLRKKITGTGPFNARIRGHRIWGVKDASVERVILWATRSMPKLDVGGALEVVDAEGKVWLLRKTRERLRLPIKDTAGNTDIDRIYTWVVSRYKVSNLGICNRRPIAGTSSWSQHSPWPKPNPGANAWDIGGKFSTLKDVKNDLLKNRRDLHVGRIIFDRTVYQPSNNWRGSPYTGVDPHTSHIHVEGSPERSGRPTNSC